MTTQTNAPVEQNQGAIGAQQNKYTFVPFFSVLVFVLGLFFIAFTIYYPVTDDLKSLRDMVVGGMLTILGTVIQYWFGSSSGSKMKETVVAGAVEALRDKIGGK